MKVTNYHQNHGKILSTLIEDLPKQNVSGVSESPSCIQERINIECWQCRGNCGQKLRTFYLFKI
jgi:hypothetical protein